jgi:hypothetical protein
MARVPGSEDRDGDCPSVHAAEVGNKEIQTWWKAEQDSAIRDQEFLEMRRYSPGLVIKFGIGQRRGLVFTVSEKRYSRVAGYSLTPTAQCIDQRGKILAELLGDRLRHCADFLLLLACCEFGEFNCLQV